MSALLLLCLSTIFSIAARELGALSTSLVAMEANFVVPPALEGALGPAMGPPAAGEGDLGAVDAADAAAEAAMGDGEAGGGDAAGAV